MGECFLYGNGGSTELNYRVYASTSTPSSPKANDIWIKSSTAVSAYRFCSNTPKGSSTSVGNVYIVAATSSDKTNDNTVPVLNILKKKMNGNLIRCLLNLTDCRQVIGGVWESVDAYLYKGGSWLQFSSAFSATINVSYPPGSTCTAICGSVTLTAPDTSGSWKCIVPNAGTWTITCKYGDKEKSVDVEITTDGQSENKTLSYELYLYNQGDTCDAVTGGWQARALGISSSSDAYAPKVTVNKSTITLQAPYKYETNSSGVYEIINDVDVSSFDSISVAISSVANLHKGAFYLVVFDRSISSWGSNDCANAKAAVKITDTGTVSLDISSISGECAIGIMTFNGYSATVASMEFSKVLLT